MHAPFTVPFLQLLSATALGAPTNGAPIRSARELYRAMFAKSGATRTFALTATVSAVNFEDRKSAIELALTDDTGSVGVIYEWSKLPVRLLPGDRIRATGRITALHGWKRQNELTELCLLAHGDQPQHHRRTIRELLSGRHDFQPVRVRATVREAIRGADNPLWTALGLVDDGCALVVPVHANDLEFRRLNALVGQDVLVDGFCSPTDPGRLHTGRQIRICDPREIRLAEAQPVTSPLPSVDDIANLSPDAIGCLGLHSASGNVIAIWQDSHVLLRTASDMAVRLALRQTPPPQVGESIEATGFPESNFISFTLLHATYRTVGRTQGNADRPENLTLRPPFEGEKGTRQGHSSQAERRQPHGSGRDRLAQVPHRSLNPQRRHAMANRAIAVSPETTFPESCASPAADGARPSGARPRASSRESPFARRARAAPPGNAQAASTRPVRSGLSG